MGNIAESDRTTEFQQSRIEKYLRKMPLK